AFHAPANARLARPRGMNIALPQSSAAIRVPGGSATTKASAYSKRSGRTRSRASLGAAQATAWTSVPPTGGLVRPSLFNFAFVFGQQPGRCPNDRVYSTLVRSVA